MYLLDTNVVSEMRKQRPHSGVVAWLKDAPADAVRIPAVVIAELQDGAELTRRQDPAKALELDRWIDHILDTFDVIPMDGEMFREWSRLMAGKSNHLMQDAMIAAAARIRHLAVVTRNVKDFASFDVRLINPFANNPKE
jgi:hypothetical protein